MSLFLIFSIILIFYGILLWYIQSKNPVSLFAELENKLEPQQNFSLIIPLVNELESLELLVLTLSKIVYPATKYQILFVLNGNELNEMQVRELIKPLSNSQLLVINEKSKKSALSFGVSKAEFENILTMDVDAVPHPHILTSYDQSIRLHYPQAIIGVVKSASEISDPFFNHFFSLEFLSLQHTQISLNFFKSPSLANGANLCFLRQSFLEVENEWKAIQTPSGDDVFLVQLFRQYNKKITLNRYAEGVVLTPLPETLPEFLQQRIRWGAKTKYYKNNLLKLLASVVLTMNFTMVISFFLAFTRWFSIGEFLILFSIKTLFDYLFLRKSIQWFELEHLKTKMIAASFLYPFYLVFAGLNAIFGKFQWKGVSYNS